MGKFNINDIGLRIKRLREEKGLTQQDMADALNVKRQTVAQWENGERDLKTGYIIDLAECLNVSSDYLLGISDYRSEGNTDIGKILSLSEANIDWLKTHSKENKDFVNAQKKFFDILNSLLDALRETNTIYELMYLSGDVKHVQEYFKNKLNNPKVGKCIDSHGKQIISYDPREFIKIGNVTEEEAIVLHDYMGRISRKIQTCVNCLSDEIKGIIKYDDEQFDDYITLLGHRKTIGSDLTEKAKEERSDINRWITKIWRDNNGND